MKFGVVGYGVVGKHMVADIERTGHELAIYDKFYSAHSGTRDEINTCDVAFICVSTPQAADGSCDVAAIDDVFSWLAVPVAIIRSTVPPGTTRRILEQTGSSAVFIPEFIGEGVNPVYLSMSQPPFLIIGGEPPAQRLAANAMAKIYNAECEFVFVSSESAEVAKYAENYFLALKVSWANELFDICQAVGADYNEMMNAVTHDHRIGRSHTHVYADDRGWGGRCLPKDTAALLALVGDGVAPLLDAVIRANNRQRKERV